MATPTIGSVPASVIAQVILASNPQRSEAVVQNNSTSPMYVGFGVNPSPAAYTTKLYTDDVLTTQFKGDIMAVWGAATGSGMVTEVV